ARILNARSCCFLDVERQVMRLPGRRTLGFAEKLSFWPRNSAFGVGEVAQRSPWQSDVPARHPLMQWRHPIMRWRSPKTRRHCPKSATEPPENRGTIYLPCTGAILPFRADEFPGRNTWPAALGSGSNTGILRSREQKLQRTAP